MKHVVRFGRALPLLVVGFGMLITPLLAQDSDGSGKSQTGGSVIRDADSSPLGTGSESSVGSVSGDSTAPGVTAETPSGDDAAASGDSGSPKEETPKAQPKKKKKKSSWWPFGRKEKPEEPKPEESAAPAPEAEPAPAPAAETPVPAATSTEGTEPAGHPAGAIGADKDASEKRLKDLQESLPPDITERAKRGDSKIADLLQRARQIRERQLQRDKEAEEEARVEEERRRQSELEAARLRRMAVEGRTEEVLSETGESTASAKGAKGDKAKKERLKTLKARREELVAEGAPQTDIDKYDIRIAALEESLARKSPAAKSKSKGKGKTKPAAKTGSKSPKGKSKGKPKAAPSPAEELPAPALPADVSPDPAGSPASEGISAPPVKRPRRKKEPAAAPPAEAPPVAPPAVPAAGTAARAARSSRLFHVRVAGPMPSVVRPGSRGETKQHRGPPVMCRIEKDRETWR
ncbi:MAG: hypothetical protein HY815_19890 [Candidatus Riflebacteria bacterium]|nr:hypothetical protein [Candidatus Riflebacteria bacterium]